MNYSACLEFFCELRKINADKEGLDIFSSPFDTIYDALKCQDWLPTGLLQADQLLATHKSFVL